MPQDALAVANFFIEKSKYRTTVLQLVKLVYIAHGYTLAITDKPLFTEPIEAWQYGPVVPSVYHTFKHFGRREITELSKEIEVDDKFNYRKVENVLDETDEHYKIQKNIMQQVWNMYGNWHAYNLIDLTHQVDSPWQKAYKSKIKSIQINNEKIKEYYKKIQAQ